MTTRDLLLEIGLEELPARFVTASMEQLAEKTKKWLTEKKIAFGEVIAYSTPRRLTVFIKDVSESQADVEEEVRGPAKKIALSEAGEWSKAAIGFTRGQGVTVEDIYFKEIKGTDYVHVNKFTKGQKTEELLGELREIVTALSFPIHMRWGNNDLRYIRPIKWLVALFGTEVIPFQITHVTTGRQTKGHRFLGQPIEITSPATYEEQLKGEAVVADPKLRKQLIIDQLKKIEEDNGWVIPVDEELLKEVNNLLEYPTALFGSFEEHFLDLPEEVLVTSMREHQRYFSVRNKEGKLLPYFVTVRNGNADHLENVARGNEKVLKARLADSEFFYEEDKRTDIATQLEKLNTVVYHEKIGTVTEKSGRIRRLANALSTKLEFTAEERADTDRAAEICKFDLVTQMVNEFPELQGLMGEKYALLQGERKTVARAIEEHYRPRHADDQPPTAQVSAVLSLADKIDTIVSFFAIDVIPTGSQDPYALRRQASGIVETLLHKDWSVPLEQLIDLSLDLLVADEVLEKEAREAVKTQVVAFFQLRLKHALQERKVRYDVVEAVLAGEVGAIPTLVARAEILQKNIDTDEFKGKIEALSRVLNIARKQEQTGAVQPELFENEYEKNLFEKVALIEEKLTENKTVEEQYHLLTSSKDVIDAYFDNIMVMADDQSIRANRLNQMVVFAALIQSFAQVNEIIVK